MYTVYIRGIFSGHCTSMGEAMALVDKYARPFRAAWEIKDGFGKIAARS